MLIRDQSTVLFIGDSITDAGRDRTQRGEGLGAAMGSGYVALIKAHFDAIAPERRLRVVNMGVSGDNVVALERRWRDDVLAIKPEWLSIMIGINDVWRQYDMPLATGAHVDVDTYEATYRRLLSATRPSLEGLVVMTPYFIENLVEDRMRARMDAYGQVARRLAREYDAVLVDTQAAFDAFLVHRHSADLAWDRVHPNVSGHLILARAWLRAVALDMA